MKTLHCLLSLLAFLTCLTLSTTAISKELPRQIVNMGVGEWSPLISQDLKHNGVVARIVEDAFALEGVELNYQWAPWKRAYLNVKNAIWDLSPAWTKNSDRDKEVLFSQPILEKYQVFFHLKSFQFDWKNIDDLKELNIGVTEGYYYGESFDNAKKSGQLRLDYASKDSQNIKKLLLGRVDVFPMNILTGYGLIQKTLTKREYRLFTHHPKKLAPPSNSYVIFPKTERGQKLLEQFNRGLQKLIKSGLYDQYFEESNKGEYKP